MFMKPFYSSHKDDKEKEENLFWATELEFGPSSSSTLLGSHSPSVTAQPNYQTTLTDGPHGTAPPSQCPRRHDLISQSPVCGPAPGWVFFPERLTRTPTGPPRMATSPLTGSSPRRSDRPMLSDCWTRAPASLRARLH
jgi:hypothetical protein